MKTEFMVEAQYDQPPPPLRNFPQRSLVTISSACARRSFKAGKHLCQSAGRENLGGGQRLLPAAQHIEINDFYPLDMSGYGRGAVEDLNLRVGKAGRVAYLGGRAPPTIQTDNGTLAKSNIDVRPL